MTRMVLLALLSLNSFQTWGRDIDNVFSGRVAKINGQAGLVRIAVTFENLKYLNKKDKVNLFHESNPSLQCRAYVVGKTNDYLLLKIPQFDSCIRNVYMGIGILVYFTSEDFNNNLKMGREVYSILLKKRLAIAGKLQHDQKELDIHIEKVNAVNERFQHLRDKLELEWRTELDALEEDRTVTLRNSKALELSLGEVDHKLEQYKVKDQNLVEDRWALDPKFYYKK